MPFHPHGCGAHTNVNTRPSASEIAAADQAVRGESSQRSTARRISRGLER